MEKLKEVRQETLGWALKALDSINPIEVSWTFSGVLMIGHIRPLQDRLNQVN
jgi:hypothetical protein